DGHHGGAGLQHRPHRLGDRHALLEHPRRVLDLAAALTGEVAGVEGLQLDDQRELVQPAELLFGQVCSDFDRLAPRHGHLAHLRGSSRERCHSRYAGSTERRTRKADIPPRTVPIRTSSCSGASTTTRTAATGRAPARTALRSVAADSMSAAIAPVASRSARSGLRTTWSEPVSGPVCTVRPGTVRSSSLTSSSVPTQGTEPRGSRVSSATTRSPGCMPGASPAQNPVASTAASRRAGPSSTRDTERSAASGPMPVRSTVTGPPAPPLPR